MALRPVTGLWRRHTKSGVPYLGCTLPITVAEGAKIMIFPNDRRESDDDAHYRMMAVVDDGDTKGVTTRRGASVLTRRAPGHPDHAGYQQGPIPRTTRGGYPGSYFQTRSDATQRKSRSVSFFDCLVDDLRTNERMEAGRRHEQPRGKCRRAAAASIGGQQRGVNHHHENRNKTNVSCYINTLRSRRQIRDRCLRSKF